MTASDPVAWPKITVVTPSFRQAQFLETTILSVLGQCYPNLEYIIMDGGSDDGSVAIIERYASQLVYWQSQRDAGQAEAINQGFARATGDILCWLNSDDFFLPGTLRKIARRLAPAVGQPALLFGSCVFFREADGAARILRARSHDLARLRETDYIFQPSSFWTRSLWEQNGPLDAALHFGFDWDWYLRAAALCDFIVHEEILSAYRRHETHKSGSGGEQRRQEILEVVRRHGTPEIRGAYEYADAIAEDYARRNQWTNALRRARIPGAAWLAWLATPQMWRRPAGISRERLGACLGMLSAG